MGGCYWEDPASGLNPLGSCGWWSVRCPGTPGEATPSAGCPCTIVLGPGSPSSSVSVHWLECPGQAFGDTIPEGSTRVPCAQLSCSFVVATDLRAAQGALPGCGAGLGGDWPGAPRPPPGLGRPPGRSYDNWRLIKAPGSPGDLRDTRSGRGFPPVLGCGRQHRPSPEPQPMRAR